MDPRAATEKIIGPVDWQTEVSGFCRCPGHALHTTANAERDCMVSIDGAPTIYCFHSSCAAAVAETNHRLRKELGASTWQLTLPGGQTLRSGDTLQPDGQVTPRRSVQTRNADEEHLLAALRLHAARLRPGVLESFHWPMQRIIARSPIAVCHRDPEDHFRTWLRLWDPSSTVWIGEVFSSGKPEHRTHFRPISDWYQIGPNMGNFTCGSAFRPGSFSRSNDNITGQRFMVLESDTLGHDEVGAVFAYVHRRLHYNLHCIVDTAGKSLHAWFDPPRSKKAEIRLKTVLHVLGCDPKLFTYSQPVRVPGAFRDGKLQRLIWLRE